MAEPPLRRDDTTGVTPGTTQDPLVRPSVAPAPRATTTAPAPTTPDGGTVPPPRDPYATGAPGASDERPTGVTILAALAAVAAVFALLGALGAFAGGALFGDAGGGVFAGILAALGVFLLVYALLAAAVAYGLLKRMRWAWYTALVLAGLGILSALLSLLAGDFVSSLLGIALNGFILWYLLKPEVQAWFGVRHDTPWKYGGRPA